MPRQTRSLIAALSSVALTLAPLSPAMAGGMGGGGGYGGGGKPGCHENKPPINIFKPININKNINIFKPIVINKNIDINKNININKNVVLNKNIVINKVNVSAEASAFASAFASAQGSAASNVIVYSGSYQIINYNTGGTGGQIAIAATSGGECHMEETTVVKSIHAVCVSAEGREYAASRMTGETWIESGYEGELARCIPGSHLRVTIGEVVQSDQGLAGTYEHGQVLECGAHEALRHFKDGMVKCAPQVPVPDCTERTNLRRYGTADFFFSFRAKVCVTSTRTSEETTTHTAEVAGMTLEGGVGSSSGY